MALKFALPFPIFAPPSPNGSHSQPPHLTNTRHRPPTEIRFSRWNNANAAEFNERRRAQEEIEEDIRRERRFSSIDRISQIDESASVAAATAAASGTVFKSTGTPSSPSRPSIPGKKSKYSKPPPRDSHPAFSKTLGTQSKGISPSLSENPSKKAANVVLSDDGLSFAIDGAPFEFKYSYTETPKVRPLRLRETPYAPFGPTTMQRPWTGRAPLPPSKKKLKEFDSFNLPPPGKKGVKPIQAPGPYLPGSAPRYAKTREEILGEPLTSEEVKDLIKSCVKSERQLNMGRDGLTHNMLDNIHAHWKRRRVCKIKCKGVCTVDMDNVKQQLEERTGGKIIHSIGGVIYLFRGRNYNYRTRPRFPLMLWKPVTPVYPRLIQRAPEGLTVQEATAMRKKGRSLIPICKLGKNGVYFKLASHVREAFEECELVRINCQGLNPSDYRKIGAKLKDLVPCILISFEDEHILMWRGRDWKSSLPASKPDQTSTVLADSSSSDADAKKLSSSSSVELLTIEDNETESLESDFSDSDEDDEDSDDTEPEQTPLTETESCTESSEDEILTSGSKTVAEVEIKDEEPENEPEIHIEDENEAEIKIDDVSEPEVKKDSSVCTEAVIHLLNQAIESGSALVLDPSMLDADVIYEQTVGLAKTAAPGPRFLHRPRRPKRIAVQITEKVEEEEEEEESGGPTVEETKPVSDRKQRKDPPRNRDIGIPRNRDFDQEFSVQVSHGSLRVDELAKLLA